MEDKDINLSKTSYQIIFPGEHSREETAEVVAENTRENYPLSLPEGGDNFIRLIKATRKGLPYESFEKAQQFMDFTQQDWAAIFHISPRSIDRLKKDKKRLNNTLSEKLIEVTLLYDYGIDIFGSTEKFSKWLQRPSLPLGKIEPKSLLDTNQGIMAVKSELAKIDHGILS